MKPSWGELKRLTLPLTLGIVFCAMPAFGQLVTGSILGTITDSSGAVVPEARVTVTDVATNVSRVFTTDSSGNYSVTDLPPGAYKVSAAKEGFSVGTHTNITLFAAATVRVDITLQPGSVTQAVTVEGMIWRNRLVIE